MPDHIRTADSRPIPNDMKTAVFILRHGQASHSAPSDHQRSLTPTGVYQARESGVALHQWLEELSGLSQGSDHELELFVSISDAQRTTETWEAMEEVLLDRQVKIKSSERLSALYLADRQTLSHHLLERLYDANLKGSSTPTMDRAPTRVFVLIGHNPGLSDLIYDLCGDFLTLGTGEFVRIKPRDDTFTRWSRC